MGVRALRVRLECDRETLLALWRTHVVFNNRLRDFLPTLFAMHHGKHGGNEEQRDLFRRVARFALARDAKDAVYLLNSVSIRGWKPTTALKMKATSIGVDGQPTEINAESWAHEAAALSARGELAYEKDSVRDGLPDSLFQPLLRDAVAYISGHMALVRDWEKEHAEWLRRLSEWRSKPEHMKYLNLRPHFEEFEKSVHGKIGKKRGRWHLYIEWLSKNPELAAWRGGSAVIQLPNAAARERIARAKPWNQRAMDAEEFWKVNPELRALDRIHGFYEREFVRRRKTKKNPDNFDHRPTFTQPHPVLHPRWVLFNAPQTSPAGYDDLGLPGKPGETGSVKLRLLTGDKQGGSWPNEWKSVSFRADPRLASFVQRTETVTIGKGRKKGTPRTVSVFRFIDQQLGGIERRAQISGAKLIFDHIKLNDDGSFRAGVAYLVLACTIDDEPLAERAKKIQWSDSDELTPSGKKRRRKTLPRGLVSCAVDLGLRNLGFLTLAVSGEDSATNTHHGVRVLRSRNQWLGHEEIAGAHKGRWTEGPDLAHIAAHKRDIRRRRRQRGKPVKGELSHVRLQQHIDHMGTDRFKKAARAIVSFALNTASAANRKTGEVHPRADVLIVEKLEGLIPDAERERGINRGLASWNRGQLVARIKEVARDAGLKVFEIPPHFTSQICSKCGRMGRRYSIVRAVDGQPSIRFGWVEKLFACECGYRANSDHNASVNLHRKFVLDDGFISDRSDAQLLWAKDKAGRDARTAEIDSRLRPLLEKLHGLAPAEPDTPF